jgi:beta-glucosidase
MPQLYQNSMLSARERAENLLSVMTLREKVGQLNQKLYGFSIYERRGEEIELTAEFKEEVEKYSGLGVLYGLYRADPWSGKNYENGLAGQLAVKTYNQVQRYVIENSRLGIPMLLSSECPHGHQALEGYLLPVNLCSGASFHPELLEEAYEVCADQLKQMGVDLALVSTLDILRDPRWGRSEECFGEDPYLASEFAKAAVTGMQKKGVAVVAKHYCAQGEGTGGINASAARIGERELREIHLPAVKACVDAGVKGVMAAYNEIDGVPCHANHWLLTKVLREEMGFSGIVMSDGVAIDRLDTMTGDGVVSGATALKAGVDVSLWDEGFGLLDEAVNRGLVTMQELDRAVLRVLMLKFELGLFEQPYLDENKGIMDYSVDSHPQSYRLAVESAVLLKNKDHILPLELNKLRSIAVIGPNADEIYHQLGDYTPPLREGEGITVLQGLQNMIREAGAEVELRYSRGCGLFDGSQEEFSEALRLASSSDLTILVLGGSSSRFGEADFDKNGAVISRGKISMDCGEGVDCANLELPGRQKELIQAVSETGSRIITVLLQGRPYAVTEAAELSDGMLCSFYNGPWGGQAIARLLCGAENPSGRLPVSIPRHTGQLPVYYNHKTSYKARNYYDVGREPLYPFGYGLGYTSFRYDDFHINKEEFTALELQETGVRISFSVTNTGSMDAYTVPQLYLRDVQATVTRRVRELKDFGKLWVPAGGTVEGVLVLTEEKLSYWNNEMKYIAEPGIFEIIVSDSAVDLWTGQIRLRK